METILNEVHIKRCNWTNKCYKKGNIFDLFAILD